jgi:hypothetical protein
MIDQQTHRPIRVSTDTVAGSSIEVSVEHLPEVQKILDAAGVRYWLDHLAISVDRGPRLTWIHLRRGSDPERVQALLDAA